MSMQMGHRTCEFANKRRFSAQKVSLKMSFCLHIQDNIALNLVEFWDSLGCQCAQACSGVVHPSIRHWARRLGVETAF